MKRLAFVIVYLLAILPLAGPFPVVKGVGADPPHDPIFIDSIDDLTFPSATTGCRCLTGFEQISAAPDGLQGVAVIAHWVISPTNTDGVFIDFSHLLGKVFDPLTGQMVEITGIVLRDLIIKGDGLRDGIVLITPPPIIRNPPLTSLLDRLIINNSRAAVSVGAGTNAVGIQNSLFVGNEVAVLGIGNFTLPTQGGIGLADSKVVNGSIGFKIENWRGGSVLGTEFLNVGTAITMKNVNNYQIAPTSNLSPNRIHRSGIGVMLADSHFVGINNNIIEENSVGISVAQGSTDNTIEANQIKRNQIGISLCQSLQSLNNILANVFIDNTNNMFLDPAC